jgi:hypothetical protein
MSSEKSESYIPFINLFLPNPYNYIKDYIHFLNTGKMSVKRDTSNDTYPKALISLSTANRGISTAAWSFSFNGVDALSDVFLNTKLSGVNSTNDVLSNEISLINGLYDRTNNNLIPDSYKKLNLNLDAKLYELARGINRSRRWIGDTKADFYDYLSNNGFVIRNRSYIFKVVDSTELESEIQNLIDFVSNRRRR